MSVKIRKLKRGGLEVDFHVTMPDGKHRRERVASPFPNSKTLTREWGEERYRKLALGRFQTKEVPTLAEFETRFVNEYAIANRQKPSTIAAKKLILKKHLVPNLGRKRLDEIKHEDIQRLKAKLVHLDAKTVNCILSVLTKLLKVAIEWQIIDVLPVTVKLLKHTTPELPFYDFEDFERLVEGAKKVGPEALAVVLLGGHAGLRRGEMVALERSDIDFKRNFLTVRRGEWEGEVVTPKGGRSRVIPMSDELKKALAAIGHLRGPRVFYQRDGSAVDETTLRSWMERAQKQAGLGINKGQIHILRHTFCSHLAMKNVPPRSIQELAGHADLTTTMRYMHLAKGSKEAAIAVFNMPTGAPKPAPEVEYPRSAGVAAGKTGVVLTS
jgi:integrase